MESQVFSNFFNEDGDWKQDKKPKHWIEDESHLLDNQDFRAIWQRCLDALPDKWSTYVKLKYLLNKNGEIRWSLLSLPLYMVSELKRLLEI